MQRKKDNKRIASGSSSNSTGGGMTHYLSFGRDCVLSSVMNPTLRGLEVLVLRGLPRGEFLMIPLSLSTGEPTPDSIRFDDI
jgi:hypothetical protein